METAVKTAIIRDTSTGACHLIDFDIDTERLAECGYELAGYLANAHRVTFNTSDDFNFIEDDSDTPEFTECEAEECTKAIMLSDEGGAPEFCNKHTKQQELRKLLIDSGAKEYGDILLDEITTIFTDGEG